MALLADRRGVDVEEFTLFVEFLLADETSKMLGAELLLAGRVN